MVVALPRGMHDLPPNEAISVKEIIRVIEEVFKRFGFYPLETPAIEDTAVLTAKAYGEESPKELFKIEDENAALRFDLTVPLARYVAMNKDLPLPFKRYQIGSIWRKEEPQRMRYREFLQADIDIVGSDSMASDAETIAACAIALDELGMKKYSIHLNSRIILQHVFEMFEVPKEKQNAVIRVIDKMHKMGREDLISQIVQLGMSQKKAAELIDFISQDVGRGDGLEKLGGEVTAAKEEIKRLNELAELVKSYGVKGKVVIDLSLARGIDYYTSFVWEFIVESNGERLPTVCSGGRYDNLISLFSSKSLPATGNSIGISRVFDALNFKSETRTYAKAFVAYIGVANFAYACKVANALRQGLIYTDLNVMNRTLSKQLEYANNLNIKYVVIVGDKERQDNKVKVRDMFSGNEEVITIEAAISKLKGE